MAPPSTKETSSSARGALDLLEMLSNREVMERAKNLAVAEETSELTLRDAFLLIFAWLGSFVISMGISFSAVSDEFFSANIVALGACQKFCV
jgi:hypothetical protein